ncbi:MAG: hypothetical protein J0M11_18360 [Anaerolineae bacterium]|nr:hypothetical protein [Anaerolineae bacterium]
MGLHKSKDTLAKIKFLKNLGECLQYTTQDEEPMFPKQKTTPALDLSWRKEQTKYPIFIFEIDTTPEKAASDNAVKVFSKPTEKYQKPLFFFHIFISQKHETDRIDSLKSQFDKVNYDVYLLSTKDSASKLITDILEQHFRIASTLDLYGLVELLEENNPLNVDATVVLNKLVELEYDKIANSNFLSIIETLLIDKKYQTVRAFYSKYLLRYLEYTEYLEQDYPPYYITAYSKITHLALSLLLTNYQNADNVFAKIKKYEEDHGIIGLWDPHFGLSRDFDHVLLSEFPLLLSLLCSVFSNSDHAKYFSAILKKIIEKGKGKEIKNMPMHGVYWLLVASKIAKDKESYNYARSLINDNGGFNINWLASPTKEIEDDEYIKKVDEITVLTPLFEEWQEFLKSQQYKNENIDFLLEVISGFLIMDRLDISLNNFASFCIQLSATE